MLDVVLRATVLLACAGLLAAGMRRATAASRHLLWCATLVALLVMLPLRIAPGWNCLPGLTPGIAPTTPHLIQAPPIAQSRLQSSLPSARPIARPSAALPVSQEPLVSTPFPWHFLLLGAWSVGIGLVLLPLAIALVALRRLRRHARILDNPLGIAALEQACSSLNFHRSVPIFFAEGCPLPLTCGILRPRIFLPPSSAGWSSGQWRMILTHELAHVQRRDVVLRLLAQLARALYWFHPLAWIACRQMEIESEKACDDLVLACGSASPDYARTLLDMAATRSRFSPLQSAAVHILRPSTLASRITRILDPHSRRGPATVSSLATSFALLVATGFVGTLRMASAQPEPNTQSVAIAVQPSATRSSSQLGAWTNEIFSLSTKSHTSISTLGAIGTPATGIKLHLAASGTTSDLIAFIEALEKSSLPPRPTDIHLRRFGNNPTDSGTLELMLIVQDSKPEDPAQLSNVLISLESLRAADAHSVEIHFYTSSLLKNTFTIDGNAATPDDATAYLARLEKDSHFTDVQMKALKADPAGNSWTFEITLSLKGLNSATQPAAAPTTAHAEAVEPGEYYVMGEVDRPGVYSLGGRQINILQAMAASAMKNDHPDAMLITLVRRNPDGKETTTVHSFKLMLKDRSKDLFLQPNDVLIVKTNTNDTETKTDPALKELLVRQAQLKSQINSLLKSAGPRNPVVVNLQNQLGDVESQIQKLQAAP
jgi:beta-lactamase regulating signal transducer with metallopeptidase domain